VTHEMEEFRIKEAYARRKALVPPGRYSWFNRGNIVMQQELERCLLSFLDRFGCAPLHNRLILDVGCGAGYWLRNLIRWGAEPENMYGIDLLDERIADARRLLPKSVTLINGNATKLEFPDATFDLVTQFTVFSSILDVTVKQKIAGEMLRVLKPSGRIIWYDFYLNNPWNPDVRGVRKREIFHLFPSCRSHFQRLTLAAPAARALGRVSPALCQMLSSIKLFSTHYLAFLAKS